MSRFLGLDIELNRKENKCIWNVGIALFKGRKTLKCYNFFIEECFSIHKRDSYGETYLKTREQLSKARNPVWLNTQKDADWIIAHILREWKFNVSFGYNSSVFDLQKLEGNYPLTLAVLEEKPHLDLMPLVYLHLVGRKSYREFWQASVEQNLTHVGNPEYAKASAELVLNYIGWLRNKGNWTWRVEDHIGVEDLIDFEYPILHYFLRILKKGMTANNVQTAFRKWDK